jgi:hypothetical protein
MKTLTNKKKPLQFFKASSPVPNRIVAVQECDARNDESSNAAK